jgi:hypothetical protein
MVTTQFEFRRFTPQKKIYSIGQEVM